MNNKPKRTNRGPSVTPGRNVYRGIRDPLVNDVLNATTTPLSYGFASATTGSWHFNLSPVGIQGLSVPTTGDIEHTTYSNARLPFLHRTAASFQEYRITRATLIITGVQSSAASGRLVVTSTTDIADSSAATTTGVLSSYVGGKSVSMATLADKEARVPINVSTNWKKVSRYTLEKIGPRAFMCINSVNDLMFSSINIAWAGTQAETDTSRFFVLSLEYDVEFRRPTSTLLNA